MNTVSAALILAWLTAAGYHDPQTTAILEYIHRESGFQPCVTGKNGSYLAQWVGSRRRSLEELSRKQNQQNQHGRVNNSTLCELSRKQNRQNQHARANNSECPPWTLQMAFMDQEIKTTFAKRLKGFFNAKTSATAYAIFRRIFGQGR